MAKFMFGLDCGSERIEEEVEFPDETFEGFTEEEIERYVEEDLVDWVNNHVNYWYRREEKDNGEI